MRHDGRQQQHHGVEPFLQDRPSRGRLVVALGERVDQLHYRRDGGVEGVAPADVVTDLGNGLVDLSSQLALIVIELIRIDLRRFLFLSVGVNQLPESLQETKRAFHRRVRPLELLIRRRGEHHVQAHGVRAVAVDHGLRVDAVVLGFGHLLHAPDLHRLAVGLELRAGDLAF